MNEFQELHERLEKVNEMIDADDVKDFEEIMWQIKELADQAYNIIGGADSTLIASRAKAYWYPSILGMTDPDSGYSGSMVNMFDTLKELKEEVHGEEGSPDYDPGEEEPREKFPRR